ncbi:MAG TPA: TerB family tellurite resistance protein [Alphaproteobacteria bacterium]|nr:TerB family tellurite resistance protein [Alphaproteobacteria bacterium]
MGLFSMFKSDTGAQMTPHLAFAIALLYGMRSDGEMDPEEVGHLLSVLGGANEGGAIGVGANNRALLDRAVQYVQRNSPDQFLAEATPLLSDGQKLCILANLLDSALADGQPEPEEQRLFEQMQRAFGIGDAQLQAIFQVISLKNDRTVFTNAQHPHNQPGFSVQLGGGKAA